MRRSDRIDLVALEGAWNGIDRHGVVVVRRRSKGEAIGILSSAGTSDVPITLRIHRDDGSVEAERTYPEPFG